MLTDVTAPTADRAARARDRVGLGEVPAWVAAWTGDLSAAAKPHDGAEHLTYLLIDQQLEAEQRQTYHRVAVRLESMQAVQHQSQWRLQLDPATQSVTLHWIKIRRGAEELDHSHLEKVRFLEREENLDEFILHGKCTLLLVLEDVRPGDVLDCCYTIEHHPRVLAQHCTSMFTLPPACPVLHHRFSVLFKDARAMKWKGSSGQPGPTETRNGTQVHWEWSGENYIGQKPDPNTPEWHVACPWIQLSDCPGWNAVAEAVATAWDTPDDSLLDELAQDIAAKHERPVAKITAALDFVQNEFRYLSLNLDLGGQIPTAPGVVARRRFGDCKDLSWLLVQLLRRLNVQARPILVNATHRGLVDKALPSAEVFNHAIVEFEIGGKAKWVDPTMKFQGGSALKRFVGDFAWGLPVDSNATALIPAPAPPAGSSGYEVTETLLLDTNRGPSLLAVVCRAAGWNADMLRRDFQVEGADAIARERLQINVHRFGQATRIGQVEYRDDREENEFVVAEVYEVNGFLAFHPEGQFCLMRFPNAFVPGPLPAPDTSPRKAPFALPYPCEVVYTTEVEAANLQPMAQPRCFLENDFLRFSRRERSLHRFWSVTLSLSTLRDAVLPEQMDEYKKAVERICREAYWELCLPSGFARPKQSRSFGQLPDPPFRGVAREPERRSAPTPRTHAATSVAGAPEPAELIAQNAAVAAGVSSAGGDPAQVAASRPIARIDPLERHSGGHRRRKKRRRKKSTSAWPYVVGGAILLLIIVVLLLALMT